MKYIRLVKLLYHLSIIVLISIGTQIFGELSSNELSLDELLELFDAKLWFLSLMPIIFFFVIELVIYNNRLKQLKNYHRIHKEMKWEMVWEKIETIVGELFLIIIGLFFLKGLTLSMSEKFNEGWANALLMISYYLIYNGILLMMERKDWKKKNTKKKPSNKNLQKTSAYKLDATVGTVLILAVITVLLTIPYEQF